MIIIKLIKQIVNEENLPRKYGRKSVEGGLSVIDSLIESEEQRNSGMLSLEFLQRAKAEMEQLAATGYSVGKAAVLVPLGVWGLSRGFATPDMDIPIMGIGNHRFFLFHSALGLVILRRLYFNWIRETRNEPKTFIGRVKRKVAGTLLGSYALGVGVHLATDVFQPKAVIFPFFGSLVDGTLLDDNLWLMGNSLWAFRISHDIFTLVLADELDAAKRFVSKHFDRVAFNELREVKE